jgi:hypothetical protein
LHRQLDIVIQDIADNILGIIYQLSLRGGHHQVRISPQLLELGFSPDKWGNDAECHHQMCHEEDRPIVKKKFESCYKSGTPFQCEYRVKTPSNTTHWFSDKAKIIMDKDGSPLFMRGVMMDITGFKVMESEIRAYHTRVDKLVLQRTEMLDRRLAIVESCNSSLSKNYHEISRMYHDLLLKTQSAEAEIPQYIRGV